jgi:hypothetical protein
MLPDNFDFAMIPSGSGNTFSLKEIGMLASTLESIDMALVSWIKELELSAIGNEGFASVPVLWQAPERAYQIKNEKSLRDDAGALKLPLISVERTGATKDPSRKGSFQAQIYSSDKNGRTGRMVLAKRIVQDKTRNFAVATGVRTNTSGDRQRYYPRVNKKVVIQTLSIPIPIYMNIDYKISITTEYQQQMNSLIQPFMSRTGQINSFVMKRNGHLYEAFMDQTFTSNNNVAALAEDSRVFKSEINIKVLGYLMGEGTNDDRPIVRVDENTVEVTFPQELVAPPGTANIFGDIWED